MKGNPRLLLWMLDGLLTFADQAREEGRFIGYDEAADAVDRAIDELEEARRAAEKQKAASGN